MSQRLVNALETLNMQHVAVRVTLKGTRGHREMGGRGDGEPTTYSEN